MWDIALVRAEVFAEQYQRRLFFIFLIISVLVVWLWQFTEVYYRDEAIARHIRFLLERYGLSLLQEQAEEIQPGSIFCYPLSSQ